MISFTVHFDVKKLSVTLHNKKAISLNSERKMHNFSLDQTKVLDTYSFFVHNWCVFFRNATHLESKWLLNSRDII
jgi:hypothetical protein